MLPIRFRCVTLARRLVGLTLLLLLGGIALGPAGAGPLEPVGVEDFKRLIDPKRDPIPDPSEAPLELTDYRRKMRGAAKSLTSLGEVAHVLLLSEWTAADFDTELPAPLEANQLKKAVNDSSDQAFQRDIRQMMTKTDDTTGVTRALVAEIKREVRLQLLERLEQRTRYYLLEGRAEDRIAASNLIRDTMTNSRRQDISMYRDPTSGAVIPAEVMKAKPEEIKQSSDNLRRRMRDLSGDLKKVVNEHPNLQVRAAAIHALSDLENGPDFLVKVYKPLLASDSDVVIRRATAEALGHALEVTTVQMDKSRPQPYLKGVKQILPVAALGLNDEDERVRRASLEACARAAQIFDDLASDPLSATERRTVFREALEVMDQILPKLNAAAKDSVPENRVAACKVMETLVLGMHKLRRFKGVESLPSPTLDPTVPPAPPTTDRERYKKKVSLPVQRSGRGRVSTGPSQWAAARPQPSSSVPLMPPVPLPGESAPVVTLDRPVELPSAPARESSRRPEAALVRTATFLAQPLDELPQPALVDSGIQGTIRILVENLKDRDYRVRLAAVDALETLNELAVPAIPALVQSLRDSNKFVRWGSARTLGRLNPRQADDVVPGLMRLLNDNEDRSIRIAAAKALEQYGEHAKAAVPLLARVINRGDKEYIIAILRTIQGIGTDAAPALPNVAWVLSDRLQPPSVRIEAAVTLGRFGSLAQDQLPILRDIMINETDEDVRNAASTAVLAVDRPMK